MHLVRMNIACTQTSETTALFIFTFMQIPVCILQKKASTCKGGKLTNRDHQSKVQENPCQHCFITLTDTCCHLKERDFTLFVSS